jgi:ribosome biogenesis GTPase A
VDIDSKVKIIDSPGVIMSSEDETVLVMRNTINAKDVKFPRDSISLIC